MTGRRQLVLLLALLAPLAAGGELVDRIVAQVDHRVILESEVEDSLRYQALVGGQSPVQFSAEERSKAIDRLVDQALIEEQIDRSTFVHSTKEDVQRQVTSLRRQVPGASDDQAWRALLARYELTEKDVDELVTEQLDIVRYVEARFRPNIRIDQRSIETYYREQFLPRLRQSGGREVPLAEVSAKIQEILVQQRVNELLALWLRNLRLQEQVHVR